MGKRITLQDLKVGEPLPWNAYSNDGVLLLRCGQSVPSQKSLERLIEEGLFFKADESERKTEVIVEGTRSALQHIVDARRMLSNVYNQNPQTIDDATGRARRMVDSVTAACDAHAGVALSSILLFHDTIYTVKHAIDTAILAKILAQELAIDAETQRSIVAAAISMNIGMYEVQEKIDAIGGPLNDKLKTMIRTHPALGAERLIKLGITDQKWITYVRQHHENADGSGYPAGLSGDAIEMGARIIRVADKYCAMISGKSYRGPQKPNVALRDLYIKEGQTIDVIVAATMIRLVGIYPIGTLVRLKTGEIGVVTGPGEGPDTPAVHAVIARSGLALEVASYRKTHLPDFTIEDVLTIDRISIPIRMASLWGKDARLA
jgi:HD-GYP domain-containing protein (c-di-GMP phosphodiesterase class II)